MKRKQKRAWRASLLFSYRYGGSTWREIQRLKGVEDDHPTELCEAIRKALLSEVILAIGKKRKGTPKESGISGLDVNITLTGKVFTNEQ